MEDIHGVDVSWLHTPNRDRIQRTSNAANSSAPPNGAPMGKPSPQPQQQSLQAQPGENGAGIPSALSTLNGVLNSPPRTPSPSSRNNRRPGLLGRTPSNEKVIQAQTSPGSKHFARKNSWLANIGSKFSSSQPPQTQGSIQHIDPTTGLQQAYGTAQTPGVERPRDGRITPVEISEPYVPSQPKPGGSSFLSSAFRRLSVSSQTGGSKAVPNGGVCPRKVLNVDPNRPRCLVPELDQNKLRRVAFCVDVEIAGGPKYNDEKEEAARKKRFAEQKAKEAHEGEALKHPEATAANTEQNGDTQQPGEKSDPNQPNTSNGTLGGVENGDTDSKARKGTRSEEEKTQRQEAKRLKAVESGQAPLQLTLGDSMSSTSSLDTATSKPTAPSQAKQQCRPTTDPLRMYRRCCQLRESGVLKRISEQLAKPSVCPATTPGFVSSLDLTGSRMQMADIATLGDWLAIVPVKKLILEDSDLTDEGVRMILAGLLAATKSDHARHQQHRNKTGTALRYEERSGLIQKLVLKNNPKITHDGWKHVSCFLYMCKSLKALDISMVPFPRNTLPQAAGEPEQGVQQACDPAEILEKSLSERRGGSSLEELVMAECNLNTYQIRKIIDGVMICGVKRLGLAGNNINEEGFEHVLRYVRSNACEAIDLAGNDMSIDRMNQLASALSKSSNLWAVSLADCKLTPEALSPVFASLKALPNFRFLDLSHNHALFERDPSAIQLLRQNLPSMNILKRLHLIDVGLTPRQAIALAEIIPECHQLAHLNILENPKLTALASASTDEGQEEAVALYASLMVAARISPTIVAIDIDVPAAENSEVVKALAKQIIAYCLRNMEYFTSIDLPDKLEAVEEIKAREQAKLSNTEMPEVLLHLVGDIGDHHDPQPEISVQDKDYIVGGTGVVKALSYMLSEKAADSPSIGDEPTSPRAGPRVEPQVTAAKARIMSKNLLNSARKIRKTLYPAMERESRAGDEMAYRRLLFLDNTLSNIIQRFETEYPECRPASTATTTLGKDNVNVDATSLNSSVDTVERLANGAPIIALTGTGDATLFDDDDSDEEDFRPRLRSRHNSDVSLAAKALAEEEGKIHRLGQRLRSKYPDSTTTHGPKTLEDHNALPEHLKVLREKLHVLDADELRQSVNEKGVEETLRGLSEKAEELKEMEEKAPEQLEKVRMVLREKVRESEGAPLEDGFY